MAQRKKANPEPTPEDGIVKAGARGRGRSWKAKLLWAFRSTRVVTPEGLRPATILVTGGKIDRVVGWDEVPEDASLRDYGDYVLLPGLVDTHVHMNEAFSADPALSRNHWEGFQTATQAAAAGGVTTVVDMPLNCVPETTIVAALEAKRTAAAGKTWVDWMTWGGVVGNRGHGGNESELHALIDAGVPGFKCFLIHSGIDGFAWADESQLRKTLAALQDSGLPLLVHAELAGPIEWALGEIQAGLLCADLNHSGHRGPDWRRYRTYLASRPDKAELDAIEMLIRLAREFTTPIHIVHLATQWALPLLRQARAEGLKITVETCPQYLWFAAEDIPNGATECKCAPPIRDGAHREALWQALREGLIDMIATDHSPCPPEMKAQKSGRFDEAWGGIASLGLALSVIWTGLSRRIPEQTESLPLLAKWLAVEPAHLARLTWQKGQLATGYDADIVVLDPDAEWTVTEADLRFRHKLSPYLGAQLRGKVLETYLRGECIYWGRTAEGIRGVLDPKAHGRELRRSI